MEMQVLAMEHALTADPELPIARPRRTVDGRPTGSVDDRRRGARRSARRAHRRHLPPHPAPRARALAARSAPPSPASTRRSPGSPTRSPTGRCSGTWPGYRSSATRLAYLATDRRALVERYLDRYVAAVEPSLASVATVDDPRRRQPRQHPRRPRRPGACRRHRRLRRPRPDANGDRSGDRRGLPGLRERRPARPARRGRHRLPRDQAALRRGASARARARRGADGPVAPHLRVARRAAPGQRRLHPRRRRRLLRHARAPRPARSGRARVALWPRPAVCTSAPPSASTASLALPTGTARPGPLA